MNFWDWLSINNCLPSYFIILRSRSERIISCLVSFFKFLGTGKHLILLFTFFILLHMHQVCVQTLILHPIQLKLTTGLLHSKSVYNCIKLESCCPKYLDNIYIQYWEGITHMLGKVCLSEDYVLNPDFLAQVEWENNANL